MTAGQEFTRWALGVSLPSSRNVGSDRARCVLIALAQYADHDGYAFPSAETIANDVAGLGRRTVRDAFELLSSAGAIERVPNPRRSTTWRLCTHVAGVPAHPETPHVAGTPATVGPGDVAGELAGDLAGDVAGDLAGMPATNRTEPKRTNPAGPRHPHEPNAQSALATLVAERSLPLTADELLIDAYRLGGGDPWAGYMAVKHVTDVPLSGARDPRRVLRHRLEGAPVTAPPAESKPSAPHEHTWLAPANAYCTCGATRWDTAS